MKRYLKADFREDHKAALARGREKRAARRDDILTQIRESEDPIGTAFHLLVPSSGKADTVAGEIVRAINRILYRDLNDGDLFYEGYGIETCGDAVAFLCKKFPYLERKFEDIAMRTLQGDLYTQAIKNIADDVIENLQENPDLISQKNTEDMFDSNGEEFIEEHGWEPEYEFECDLPENVAYHISNGNMSKRDAEEEISDWDGMRDADIKVTDWGIIVSGIGKDLYDELEYNMYNWLEQWGEDLDDAFGRMDDEEDYDY